jgi:hypothetical protein
MADVMSVLRIVFNAIETKPLKFTYCDMTPKSRNSEARVDASW